MMFQATSDKIHMVPSCSDVSTVVSAIHKLLDELRAEPAAARAVAEEVCKGVRNAVQYFVEQCQAMLMPLGDGAVLPPNMQKRGKAAGSSSRGDLGGVSERAAGCGRWGVVSVPGLT